MPAYFPAQDLDALTQSTQGVESFSRYGVKLKSSGVFKFFGLKDYVGSTLDLCSEELNDLTFDFGCLDNRVLHSVKCETQALRCRVWLRRGKSLPTCSTAFWHLLSKTV
jgi:hypothetical protein